MWYYVENSEQRGPVTDADLESLRKAGTVSPETLVWREGMANWQPYSEAFASPDGGVAASPGAGPKATSDEVVCSECGKVFPPNEVIRYGNAAVCAACKPIFVQKLKEGATIGSGAMDYATFWTRFAAYFLDGIITRLAGGALGVAIGFAVGAGGGTNAVLMSQIIAGTTGFILSAAYYIFFVGKYGATPGKMACKIKVVCADGSPVGYGKATGRFFGYLLSGIICGIGFLMAAWDEEKRALHDRLCNTRVIKR